MSTHREPPLDHWPIAAGRAPQTSAEALECLNEGNARFAQWVAHHASAADFPERTGLAEPAEVDSQTPFGVVIGCSDARFPLRSALGQGANRLFEIRVAGNVLAEECLGSVDYALAHLPSVKTIVVLGHTHCGAVTAASGAFLHPAMINSSEMSTGLRAIVRRLLGPVLHAADAIRSSTPTEVRFASDQRRMNQLIQTAIYAHAATAAFDLQTAVRQSGRTDVNVLHGVFDLSDYYIRSPQIADAGEAGLAAGLGAAPADAETLQTLVAAAAHAAVSGP